MVFKYDEKTSIGQVIPIYKNIWQYGKFYETLDVVSDIEQYSVKSYNVNECIRYGDTSIYRCIKSNSQISPASTNYWVEISKFQETDIPLRSRDYICISANYNQILSNSISWMPLTSISNSRLNASLNSNGVVSWSLI